MTVVQKIKTNLLLIPSKDNSRDSCMQSPNNIVASETKILDWPLELETPYKMTLCYQI